VLLLSGYYPGGLQDAAALAHSANGPCAPERGFPEHALLHVLGQVASAVAHLHAQDPAVAHRDVKMENVLLDCAPGECAAGRGRVVLCDFGSATTRAQVYETRGEMLEEEERIQKFTTAVSSFPRTKRTRLVLPPVLTGHVSSQAYRAPEMVDLYQKQRVDTKVDVWALGVLLFLLAYNYFPFDPTSPLATLSGRYVVPSGAPEFPRVARLLAAALATKPAARCSVGELIALIEGNGTSAAGGGGVAVSVQRGDDGGGWADFGKAGTDGVV
jgi:AP2-associated kinase